MTRSERQVVVDKAVDDLCRVDADVAVEMALQRARFQLGPDRAQAAVDSLNELLAATCYRMPPQTLVDAAARARRRK